MNFPLCCFFNTFKKNSYYQVCHGEKDSWDTFKCVSRSLLKVCIPVYSNRFHSNPREKSLPNYKTTPAGSAPCREHLFHLAVNILRKTLCVFCTKIAFYKPNVLWVSVTYSLNTQWAYTNPLFTLARNRKITVLKQRGKGFQKERARVRSTYREKCRFKMKCVRTLHNIYALREGKGNERQELMEVSMPSY